MRLTDIAPPYCSSCFQQKIGVPHVDLMVVWDGPVIEGANGNKYPIDDIIICIDCAHAIANLLPDRAERMIELEKRLSQLERDHAAQLAYVTQLEQAVALRPETIMVGKPLPERKPRQRREPVAKN